ncbi:MAG: flagellar protein FlaG [Burkholderiaceae bacterium]|nr:flagellar protein FlaG [Burkholderiaceae bacterium]
MNPLSALPAQAQAPQTPAVQPKVVVQQPKSAPVEQKAPEAKVDAAGEAAAAAAKARAEVNVEQYARATKEVMQVAAQQIQGYLRESGRNLNVTLDESTGKYVARVVNPETGEVVRSLPSEETLRIARNIDQMRGMLVNQRA